MNMNLIDAELYWEKPSIFIKNNLTSHTEKKSVTVYGSNLNK